MLRRLVRRWVRDNVQMGRAFWHIVRCPRGEHCDARYMFVWAGDSYSAAASHIGRRGCFPRRPK